MDFLNGFTIRVGQGGNMIRIVRTFLGVCFFLVFWTGFVQSAEVANQGQAGVPMIVLEEPTSEEANQGQAGVPIIVLEEPTYDFGQVSEGEVITHDFRVVNQGTAPLEIKNVKPG